MQCSKLPILPNEFENVHTPEFPAGMSIVAIFTMNLNIINCTFTGNQYYGPTIGDAPVKVTDEVYATLQIIYL